MESKKKEKIVVRNLFAGKNGETDIENRLVEWGEGRREWDVWKE